MFTNEELDMLMRALDALESSESTNSLLSTMLGGLISKNAEDARKYMEGQTKKFEDGEAARRQLKDRIIVLKAKLISLRDTNIVSEMDSETLT